ncbi:Hypothetical_protein [Hexamita inflata]|uniref:Hypothetical_protein n=1 Tax=Hexamita inflata TaxID=28002 RepID=A0ABP1KJM7_9EUKA
MKEHTFDALKGLKHDTEPVQTTGNFGSYHLQKIELIQRRKTDVVSNILLIFEHQIFLVFELFRSKIDIFCIYFELETQLHQTARQKLPKQYIVYIYKFISLQMSSNYVCN